MYFERPLSRRKNSQNYPHSNQLVALIFARSITCQRDGVSDGGSHDLCPANVVFFGKGFDALVVFFAD